MSGTIKGITIELAGDTKGLDSALKSVTSQSVTLGKDLKTVNQLLKLDPGNAELVAQKQQILAQSVEATAEKLEILRNAQAQVKAQFEAGEISREQYIAFQEELVRTESRMDSLKSAQSTFQAEMDGTANSTKTLTQTVSEQKKELSELKAKYVDVAAAQGEDSNEAQELATQIQQLSGELKENEDRLNDLRDQADKLSDSENELEDDTKKLGNSEEETEKKTYKLGDALKKGLVVGAKAAAAAIAAVGTASIALVKNVIEKTGELEQNLGGSVSVFGKYAEQMQRAGEDAYKNLGISQSEYLATANKMGALFQGVGLSAQDSASITEKAMQRAADMASVMGIDMASAMESVAGAAKGNFTMMDNLGVAINDTSLKAYAAAHGLGELETTQEKVTAAMQMFLDTTEQYDGNFAKEATETISGSFGLLEASWESMIAGLGNSDADIGKLAGNVADALSHVIDNVEPVIESVVNSLPQVVDATVGAVKNLLPKVLPSIQSIFTNVLNSVVEMLPAILPVASSAILTFTQGMIDNLPTVISIAGDIILQLADALLGMLPQIVDTGMQVIAQLAIGIADALPTLIPTIVDVVLQIVETLIDNIDLLIDASIQLIMGLAQGLINALPVLLRKAPEIVQKLATAIVNNAPKLLKSAVELIVTIVKGIVSSLPDIVSSGWDIIKSLASGILQMDGKIADAAQDIIARFSQKIKELPKKALQWGKDIISGIVDGIKSKISAVTGAVSSVAGKIKSFLHFSVPDEGPLTDFPTWMPDMMKGLSQGIIKNMKYVQGAVSDLAAAMVPDIDLAPALAQYDASRLKLPDYPTRKPDPDDSRSLRGFGGGSTYNITINVERMDSDTDVRRTAEVMAEEIDRLEQDNNSLKGTWSA